ncbi:hypothetical protein ZWY2020_042156 [Hordeum vulgare]|nr:hypothetical protein ZWY2020_042156 [Hordeum vulgare]
MLRRLRAPLQPESQADSRLQPSHPGAASLPTAARLFTDATNFGFHIISSQEDPRVLCFAFDFFQAKAVVRVISPVTSIKTKRRRFPGTGSRFTGKMVNGTVYWTHVGKPYITVLDTATLKFSKMDLPPLLPDQEGRECAFVFGNTKDGRPCIVSPDLWGDCSLHVFFWRREDEYYDDGRNYWMLDQTFPLKTIRQFVKFSEGDDEFIIVRLMDVIDGIVGAKNDVKIITSLSVPTSWRGLLLWFKIIRALVQKVKLCLPKDLKEVM